MSEIIVKVVRNIGGCEAVFEGQFGGVQAALSAAHELAGLPLAQTGVAGETTAKPAAVDTKKQEPKADPKDAKPAAKDAAAQKSAKPETTAKAESADAAPAGDSAKLDYTQDIRPLVVKVSQDKGRDTITALLQRFGVGKGPELKPEQWAEFKDYAERTLSGDYNPLEAEEMA